MKTITIDLDQTPPELAGANGLHVCRVDIISGGKRITAHLNVWQHELRPSPTLRMTVSSQRGYVVREAQAKPWVEDSPREIRVVGKRWFDGNNTYHSVDFVVDNRLVWRAPYEYGYGNHYLTTVETEPKVAKLLPGFTPGDSLRLYCEKHGIKYSDQVTDVKRKKEL